MNAIINRRAVIRSSAFGLLAASMPNILFAKSGSLLTGNDKLFHRYPSIDDAIVSEVVGASHFNLDRVKELVGKRPELARATWDWGFGDWETALGAASHVGRRDIAEYLMNNGARPDIFTFAMFGDYNAVVAMVEAKPGVQSIAGPHGITLLQHVRNGLERDGLTVEQKNRNQKLITYLESLGNADVTPINSEMEEAEMQKYLGNYMYGDGPEDGFTVRLNMRKIISLGKLNKFGGSLYNKGDQQFEYNGAPSVTISFQLEREKVISLTVTEPDLTLVAKKV
jgi:hypothetical protein